MKLRQSIKPIKTISIGRVHHAGEVPQTVARPFPVQCPPSPARWRPPGPQRADVCYNCNKPGHYAAQCAEPYRPRERKPTPPHRVNPAVEGPGSSDESDIDASKNE